MKALMDLRTRRRQRSEAGFALIEVIVSAAVLALMALAVLSGIDGATASSGREKARGVAAALAEQDQERLRSMPVEQLSSYGIVDTPYTVDGTTYNVNSNVQWVRDDTGGTISCANADGREADYLHITSTVTSSVVGSRIPAVKVDSIVAPDIQYSTTHGSLAVKVLNVAGQGVPGVLVTPTGASSPPPQTTNAQGCAVFQNIDVGDYSVAVSAAGYVDRFGNPVATVPAHVSAGKLTLVSALYDQAATVNTSIETYKPGTTTNIVSKAWRVSMENGDDVSFFRNVPTRAAAPSAEQSAFSVTGLFPFKGAYTFYTGACRYSDPTFYSGNTAYYGTYPGSVATTPGGTFSTVVRQPPLNFRITRDLGGSLNAVPDNMTVIATPQQAVGDSCIEPSISLTTVTTVVGSTTTKGIVARNLSSDGTYVEAGLPFGNYKLCIQRVSGTGVKSWTMYPDDYGTTNYDNTAATGQATQVTIDASASGKWHTTNGGVCTVTP